MIFSIKTWLPLALAITLIYGAIYATGQQILRQGANDPQIQLAEDAGRDLDQGATATTVVGQQTVDLGTSLAPFLMVVDSKGTVVASSGVINGQAQKPPQGALDYATAHGQHRVTWQPTATIRQAVVIQPYSHGWVISGRSLREVEVRIAKLSLQLGTAWFITLALSFLMSLFLTPRKK